MAGAGLFTHGHRSIALLERGHRLVVESLYGLDDDALERQVKTNWGESGPAWRIFWTMIHHDLWLCSEIGPCETCSARSATTSWVNPTSQVAFECDHANQL